MIIVITERNTVQYVAYILSLSDNDVLLTKNSTANGIVVLGSIGRAFNVVCDCVTMFAATENMDLEVGTIYKCLVGLSLRSFVDHTTD